MKPIHRTNFEEFDALLAWARYLFWCDLHRRRFEAWIEEPHDISKSADKWYFIALVSQWYASLWVVIEGWQKAAFDDAAIDRLLNGSGRFCERLRRYRNGIYHYQPRLLEPRLLNFLAEADETVPWVDTLHDEFLRFFEEMLSTFPGKENQKALRDSVLALIGWLPTDTPAARLREVEDLCDHAQSLVQQSKDPSSVEVREVIAAADEARAMAKDATVRYRAWRNGLVDFLTKKGQPQ